jgi:hypothetical protein
MDRMIRFIIVLLLVIHPGQVRSQDFYGQLSDKTGRDIPKISYGKKSLTLIQRSANLDLAAGRREVQFEARELPALRIRVVSEIFNLAESQVLYHEIELSSSVKLKEDLTIRFPVNALDKSENFTFPLKNGIIGNRKEMTDDKIASYRCAGKPEKYDADLALPLVLVDNGSVKYAVMTDPFFTSLFDVGCVKWTYPKEVGFEDSVEKRTIMEAGNIPDIDKGMSAYYQTILKDVPPGPGWMKDIAMISYDYMSDMGRGWYNDIDSLAALIPQSDRNRVALCLHGWYDIIGRYCYNEKSGKLDETWTNRIRGIELSLSDLHHRINYAREKGFVVLMYFADGMLSSKGLPTFNSDQVLEEGGWNGPDVVGGPYRKNLACKEVRDFYRNYARALFNEFANEVSGFVWDETFYIQAGTLGTPKHPGYLDRAHMRLIKEIAALLHSVAPGKAFFASDDISDGKSFTGVVPPYALLADGCYQDSWCLPDLWSYGIFPNYRNVIWSCNWHPLTNFNYTVFGVYAYNTPAVFTNGWEDDRGFSEMTIEEKNNFISLFNYRKQFHTQLKGLNVLPPYFEFKK